jgi:DNA-binding response OmpR family regulator
VISMTLQGMQSPPSARGGMRAAEAMPESQAHIVVVDDEPEIRETLREYLELQGFRVTKADGGEALREVVAAGPVDLVILDISMPGEDGLSLARYLRATSEVGIIMLTAAGEVIDKIIGLEVGADDYLAKPVDLRELLAHIKAVLRRTQAAAPSQTAAGAEADASAVVPFGRCQLDLNSHRLIAEDGSDVPLTAMEYDLLRAFAEHPNRVLSRDQLLDLAHSKDWEPFDRSIDIRITRIRRKIEPDPAKPQVIKTVRGAGYIYAPGGD